MDELESLREENWRLKDEIHRHHQAHNIIVRLLGGVAWDEVDALRREAEALRVQADAERDTRQSE